MAESANLMMLREMLDQTQNLTEAAVDAWLENFTEDAVWDAMEDAPDAGTYRGHTGIRGYAQDWFDTVDDVHFEVSDLFEVGDCAMGKAHFSAKIRGTENELALDYWVVWGFADGKIRRIKEFRERDDAITFAEAGAPNP